MLSTNTVAFVNSSSLWLSSAVRLFQSRATKNVAADGAKDEMEMKWGDMEAGWLKLRCD